MSTNPSHSHRRSQSTSSAASAGGGHPPLHPAAAPARNSPNRGHRPTLSFNSTSGPNNNNGNASSSSLPNPFQISNPFQRGASSPIAYHDRDTPQSVLSYLSESDDSTAPMLPMLPRFGQATTNGRSGSRSGRNAQRVGTPVRTGGSRWSGNGNGFGPGGGNGTMGNIEIMGNSHHPGGTAHGNANGHSNNSGNGNGSPSKDMSRRRNNSPTTLCQQPLSLREKMIFGLGLITAFLIFLSLEMVVTSSAERSGLAWVSGGWGGGGVGLAAGGGINVDAPEIVDKRPKRLGGLGLAIFDSTEKVVETSAPQQPIPTKASPVEDINSDKALLRPILGNDYQSFLKLRQSRFRDMATNESERWCRHPEFFDYDYTWYNVTDNGYAQEWSDAKVRSHFKWRKRYAVNAKGEALDRRRHDMLRPEGWDHKEERWVAGTVHVGNKTIFVNSTIKKGSKKPNKAQLQLLADKPKPRSMTFVHVGKAGGSTILCNIREAFKFGKVHCPGYTHENSLQYAHPEEDDSAISASTNCYVHYDERLYCYDNPTFVVNVRNPIHRLMSWYLYEHRENWDATVDHVLFPNRPKHCGQQMLFACYPTLDSLATIGLAGDRPSDGELLTIGPDLSEYDCRHWAWSGVRGRVPASFHNLWNYEWYLQHLLKKKEEAKAKAKAKEKENEEDTNEDDIEIFVLRIENLKEDWNNLDKLLGGKGSALPASSSHANDASEKALVVTNRTISADGMANLCRALCAEIQVYKQILAVADNLNPFEVQESLKELQKTCPEERSLHPRDCL